MTHEQIYNLVNTATQEALGASALVEEDLGNLVDIGTQLFNANAVDEYVRSLINHIGKVIFVNRVYDGSAPSVLRDGFEYGSVLEKVSFGMPSATENETWELENGQSVDPNIFYKPDVSAKFFNKRTTFEIPLSVAERQVKQSFSNGEQLNAFVSGLFNAVSKSRTVKNDSLIMRTINNFVGETLYDEYAGSGYTSKSTNKAVNLLYLYNQAYSKSLTAAACLYDPDFLRFAIFILGNYERRMRKISSLFNIGETDKFTPADLLHVVLHADFASAASVFLYSDTFHKDLVALPKAETVPYWQGSGTSYAFADTTKIDVVTAGAKDVSREGILGVMFDHDALGVANYNERVTTNYNGKGEFFNYWFKNDAGYFNDFNENFVVFFVA